MCFQGALQGTSLGCTRRGSYSAKGRVSAFLSAFYNTPLRRTLLRTSVSIETLTRCLLRTLLRSTELLENLLRTLLRSARLHDPLGVRPTPRSAAEERCPITCLSKQQAHQHDPPLFLTCSQDKKCASRSPASILPEALLKKDAPLGTLLPLPHKLKFGQPQSITQKGVHAHSLTAQEREHCFFAAFEPFSSCEFRASIARTPFCAILWRSPKSEINSPQIFVAFVLILIGTVDLSH